MQALPSLSPIGIGTYRMSDKDPEHKQVLRQALALGCNLIDTSSNYRFGASEKLIGAVLASWGKAVFVVTKGGYVSHEVRNHLSVSAKQETTLISDHFGHCIHPDFLQIQLAQSQQRLQGHKIGGYLLHNPEYYLKHARSETAKEILYERLRRAFAFLETAVQAGKITYYGISSNTFAFPVEEPYTISLPKVWEIATTLRADHHFRLIQFPYNLLENQASEGIHAEGKSLIAWAQSKGILTMGNRPFNANYEGMGVRLAEYERSSPPATSASWSAARSVFKKELSFYAPDFLNRHGRELRRFLTQATQLPNLQYFEYIFHKTLRPSLREYFDGALPSALAQSLTRFEAESRDRAVEEVNELSTRIRKQLSLTGKTKADDKRSLQQILCEVYLEAGLDHVLAGMRKPKYLKLLTPELKKI